MGWIGGIAGFFAGQMVGGTLGGIIGAALGSHIENSIKQSAQDEESIPRNPSGNWDNAVFFGAMAAMLAKIAKADGHVSHEEIGCVEAIFKRLGLAQDKRDYMIRVFRSAKDDPHSIHDYARDFANAVPDADFRAMLYSFLWDVACADGILAPEEEQVLRDICASLRLPRYLFDRHYSSRIRSEQSRSSYSPPPRDTLAEAYSTLGVSPSATDAEIQSAYREKAKKFHPDRLRAQGLSETLVKKATEQMALVNAAYDEIKKFRRI